MEIVMAKKTETKTKESLFDRIKSNIEYDEEKHCRSIIEILSSGHTITDFLTKHGISKQRMVSWQMQHTLFRECFMLGRDIGKQKWIMEGLSNIDNKEFNFKVWEMWGRQNYGGMDKVSLFVDPTSTPIQQYQQILYQSTCGDFSSSEIKQVMESINIGIRAYETGELEDQIKELQDGLKKMEEREIEHQIQSTTTPKENKITLDS
jgi:hypothetical protein